MEMPLDPRIPALGIRQPWVELILRGDKVLEIRSRNTRVRGPIYLYSSQRPETSPVGREMFARRGLINNSLPYGVLVGSAELVGSRPTRPSDAVAACLPPQRLVGQYAWELQEIRRFTAPVPVTFQPYGVWFYPFVRKSDRAGE
ncbi:MAG: hypothetical protein ACK5V1_00455 [Planctomycetaceae bacterium]|jgi:hypothetical protein